MIETLKVNPGKLRNRPCDGDPESRSGHAASLRARLKSRVAVPFEQLQVFAGWNKAQ
jgi:hypothetical protein